jgi:hypothetical protein
MKNLIERTLERAHTVMKNVTVLDECFSASTYFKDIEV